ncbi:protein Wnt-1 [Lingula anatina]|uniref:Protein Wnt n=1 Tax=Lingula anatina TaxID=7574 RepID=A0A1S3KBL6_LINAN|nr:protein Wnt-1 [Lingula anatina]XP_013420029.1 protein Wnt-1 [Lingula anatina]XP_023931322.1 protein Wnt-1 [Lingula anatina]|eukprot:XP_013420028.1 protein Wnt-1 [Lingula anatina]
MKLNNLLVFLCFLMAHMSATKKSRLLRGVRWWALANVPQPQNTLLNPSSTVLFNPSLQPLSRKQRKLVAENQGTIIAIAKGARLAVDECQHQFKNRKWNCPTSDDSHGGNIFGKIMLKGCRETSFIYSITSAAVTYQLARACAEGIISTCTCDYRQLRYPSVDQSGKPWEWGGCSDNMEFGLRFGKSFTDGVEKGRDLRYIMNRHNNGAGRLHVQNQMERDCKCHGMSGSCTVKTCWMRLPKFRTVGDLIKGRFDGASRVYQGKSNDGRLFLLFLLEEVKGLCSVF